LADNRNKNRLTEVPFQAIVFVDRVLPSFIGKYFSGGIITVYVGLIILLGKVIRSLIASNPLDVIISEIPNPDYLLKICLDIYLVREATDFTLEQDLFAKLIFLFRSPATLIKWTRYRIKED
jgi:piezo-type mechanosensitive ion channel component 1/2